MKTAQKLALGLALLAGVGSASVAQAAAGDWIIRARALAVAPQYSSSGIQPTFADEEVALNTAYTPELDFTYMVTNNIGLELIAGTTKHSASGTTGTTGSIGKLADTWVLPPTLTLQYHFAPDAAVRPYLGVGMNYTIFYNERAAGGLVDAVGETKVSMSDSFGYALNAGVDVPVNDTFFVNLDVKYIDIKTTATLNTADIGIQRVKVDVNPIVVGIGLGMRF